MDRATNPCTDAQVTIKIDGPLIIELTSFLQSYSMSHLLLDILC